MPAWKFCFFYWRVIKCIVLPSVKQINSFFDPQVEKKWCAIIILPLHFFAEICCFESCNTGPVLFLK